MYSFLRFSVRVDTVSDGVVLLVSAGIFASVAASRRGGERAGRGTRESGLCNQLGCSTGTRSCLSRPSPAHAGPSIGRSEWCEASIQGARRRAIAQYWSTMTRSHGVDACEAHTSGPMPRASPSLTLPMTRPRLQPVVPALVVIVDAEARLRPVRAADAVRKLGARPGDRRADPLGGLRASPRLGPRPSTVDGDVSSASLVVREDRRTLIASDLGQPERRRRRLSSSGFAGPTARFERSPPGPRWCRRPRPPAVSPRRDPGRDRRA